MTILDNEVAMFGNHWYIAAPGAGGPVPEGLRGLTPFLHSRGTAEKIEFPKQAFGTEEILRATFPEESIAHAKVQIGNSVNNTSEAHGSYQQMPCTVYRYGNTDALSERAIHSKATSLHDQP